MLENAGEVNSLNTAQVLPGAQDESGIFRYVVASNAPPLQNRSEFIPVKVVNLETAFAIVLRGVAGSVPSLESSPATQFAAAPLPQSQ